MYGNTGLYELKSIRDVALVAGEQQTPPLSSLAARCLLSRKLRAELYSAADDTLRICWDPVIFRIGAGWSCGYERRTGSGLESAGHCCQPFSESCLVPGYLR